MSTTKKAMKHLHITVPIEDVTVLQEEANKQTLLLGTYIRAVLMKTAQQVRRRNG